jgi:hypothetical protein
MRLDSALALQASLLSGFGPKAGLSAQGAREGGAARRTADLASTPPELAIGISRREGEDYQLAVRVQRRALLDSERLKAILDAASGEADVRYVGRVEKLQAGPQSRHRPLAGGISVGHHAITAGTLGCFVQSPEGLAILSNNHVLADENRAQRGESIIQPGSLDGGSLPGDVVATLGQYVPLQSGAVNRLDAALAPLLDGLAPDNGAMLKGGTPYPTPISPEDALGLEVIKLGRTTGHTRGFVSAFNVNRLGIAYDTAESMIFDGQIEIEPLDSGTDFSDGGDSGSLILTADERRPVGLLFAGGDQGGVDGGPVTYANPIQEVLDALHATLYI